MTAEQVKAVLYLYDERAFLQHTLRRRADSIDKETRQDLIRRLVHVEAKIAHLEATKPS